MKKLDWKGVGQFLAIFVRLVTIITSIFKHNKVGLEIMEWLTESGLPKLQDVCIDLVGNYKGSEAYKRLTGKNEQKAERKLPDLTKTGKTFADLLEAREKLHFFLTGETLKLQEMFVIPDGLLRRTDIMPVFRPVGASNRTAMDWKKRLGWNASYEEADVMKYRNSEGPQIPQLFFINYSVKPDAITLGDNAQSPDGLVQTKKPWLNLYGWSDADNLYALITGVHLDSGETWTWFPDDRLPGGEKVAGGRWLVSDAQANFSWRYRGSCGPHIGARVARPLSLKS